MANKKGDTTRIQAVPDVNKCTNLGCYSMKEREAYAVKTRKDQMLSTIYYFPDFEKPYTNENDCTKAKTTARYLVYLSNVLRPFAPALLNSVRCGITSILNN